MQEETGLLLLNFNLSLIREERFKMAPRKSSKTRIVVQMDTDSSSRLFLRGEGISGLSWEKGVEMTHTRPDEWVFETEEIFSAGSFKVLIDDQTFELGDTHSLYPGASIRINPQFPEKSA